MPIKYYFNFKTSNYGRKEVEEFIGADAVGFSLTQRKEKGAKGRDVLFSGNDDAKYTISPNMNHCFDIFTEEARRYRHEAEIGVEIEYGESITVLGDVNFGEGFDTDGETYATFTVIPTKKESRLRRNSDTTLNGLSGEALIGGDITPPPIHKALVKAKPILQRAIWDNVPPKNDGVIDYMIDSNLNGVFMNSAQTTSEYDIQNTLSWLYQVDTINGASFRLIGAVTNYENVYIRFDMNVLYQYRPNEFAPGLDKAGSFSLVLKYGFSYDTATEVILYYNGSQFEENLDFQLPPVIEYTIPFLNATDSVWAYFRFGSQNGAVNRAYFYELKITAEARSVALNTVIPVLRYIDVLKYAVKSATGMDLNAPIYDYGGELYNQFITTPTLMRNLTDKPFYITLKEIFEKHIRTELNGDYEVENEDSAYIGRYEDFYRDFEMIALEEAERQEQLYEGFSYGFNPEMMCNRFVLKFDNYASQKEQPQDNTFDIVHGELEYRIANENSENTREGAIGFVRDPFLKEQERRKAYQLSKSTATQDDDKKYMFDMVALPPGTNFTETALLQHGANGGDFNLVLRINQEDEEASFNWTLLGIDPSKPFILESVISTPVYNIGTYTVTNITPNELFLTTTGGFPQPIPAAITRFKYYIASDVVLTDRTSEGFTQIDNILDGNRFGDLLFTTKRIMQKRYGHELASLNICHPNTPLKNTKYLQNAEALTRFQDETFATVEGADYIPKDPILDTGLYNITLACRFTQFWELITQIRTERGYIRTWNTKGLPIKLYPADLEWTPIERGKEDDLGNLRLVGKEKYDPYFITIFADSDTVRINNKIEPTGFYFSVDGLQKLSLFDSTGKLLYVPVPFDRVRFNGAIAATALQLKQWLSQYATVR